MDPFVNSKPLLIRTVPGALTTEPGIGAGTDGLGDGVPVLPFPVGVFVLGKLNGDGPSEDFGPWQPH